MGGGLARSKTSYYLTWPVWGSFSDLSLLESVYLTHHAWKTVSTWPGPPEQFFLPDLTMLKNCLCMTHHDWKTVSIYLWPGPPEEFFLPDLTMLKNCLYLTWPSWTAVSSWPIRPEKLFRPDPARLPLPDLVCLADDLGEEGGDGLADQRLVLQHHPLLLLLVPLASALASRRFCKQKIIVNKTKY
jgi:hypothetical protein